MAIKLERKHLQQDKYNYTWTRDIGDKPYSGLKDRIKVDKDEGYEVLPFLEHLMNQHGKTTLKDVHASEDVLQSDALSDVVMRDELALKVAKKLGW